jgi:hypothetical protein
VLALHNLSGSKVRPRQPSGSNPISGRGELAALSTFNLAGYTAPTPKQTSMRRNGNQLITLLPRHVPVTAQLLAHPQLVSCARNSL